MNSHQRRKTRRQNERDYPGLCPHQIALIKSMRRLIARSPLLQFQQIGRALRPLPEPTGPTIAELQHAGHLQVPAPLDADGNPIPQDDIADFDPDADHAFTPYGADCDEESWHYLRRCAACGTTWYSLHCRSERPRVLCSSCR